MPMLIKAPCGFALREYIPVTEESFTAFWAELPIRRERRYFAESGKVFCRHPYWIEDAIKKPSRRDWQAILERLNSDSDESSILDNFAAEISSGLEGYWSVDFMLGPHGWLLIDMAVGEESWHPSDCPKRRIDAPSEVAPESEVGPG